MSLFRKEGSGGFDGTIDAVTFEAKEWDGKGGNDSYSTLTAKVNVTPDGATVSQERFLRAGFVNEGITVNDDGTLSLEGEAQLSENTEFARFVLSAIENGREEADFSGDDFSGLTGYRYRFINFVDTEATKQFGKRKGKDGKEYNRTEFRISKVYGPAEVKGKKAAATKVVAKGNGAVKSNGKATTTTSTDDKALETVLLDLVTGYGKDGQLNRAAINQSVVRYSIKKKMSEQERDSLREQLVDEDVLTRVAELGTIAYIPTGGDPKQKGVIAVA